MYADHTIVVPAAKRAKFNRACQEAGLSTAGSEFFALPLYQGNSKQPTHYAAYCTLGPQQRASLERICGRAALTKLGKHEQGARGLDKVSTGLGCQRKPADQQPHEPQPSGPPAVKPSETPSDKGRPA